MRFDLFCFETIRVGGVAPSLCPFQSQCYRHIKYEGQIWMKITKRHALERLDQALIDLAEHPLIDARGIGEAIANHPMACVECRQNSAADMVVAGGGKQHGLRLRT